MEKLLLKKATQSEKTKDGNKKDDVSPQLVREKSDAREPTKLRFSSGFCVMSALVGGEKCWNDSSRAQLTRRSVYAEL